MKSIEGIKSGLQKKESKKTIARKVFLSYATEIFRDKEDKEFYIKNKISEQFNVPFSSVEVAGSSKTGLSFFREKLFEPGKSDLDIAIISLPLFNKFVEVSHNISKGYTDQTQFPIYKGQNTAKQFINGISKGFINPYYMPKCDIKYAWLDFFNRLSNSHYDLFKNINGGIYASEYFFEVKQEECIELYTTNEVLYDELSRTI